MPQMTPEVRTYRTKETDLILDLFDERYVMKIRDLPAEERPREKLTKRGVAALTVEELLAIVLGVGSRKEDVLAMSRRLLKEYGGGAVIHEKDPKKLSRALDLPIAKACQLVACFELGRRFFRTPALGRPEYLRSAKQVYEYLRDMRNLHKEHFRGLYLDPHFRLIHDEVISVGSLNANLVHPREVFKPAIDHGASAVILAHNHPSGVSEPSGADVEVTAQLTEAGKILGIHVLDHVIVTARGFACVPADYS